MQLPITSSTTSICAGGSVTFTATPVNGGPAPTYQWQINGIDVTGETGSTFTTTTLVNGDIVTVIMTSNDPCANPAVANSNQVTITTTTVVPAVTITSSTTSICAGGSVTFTATPVNGGPAPTYQWQINGIDVTGETGSTFTTTTLTNNDIVTVIMTSKDPCANPVTATSNAVTITTTTVTPSVTIAASTTSICAGGSVTFTATPVNGGPAPTYQWQINGIDVTGETAATFTTTTLVNGDIVTVIMTSNDPCANPVTTTSNAVTITATTVTPSVAIAASTTSICAGGSVTFTATPVNGGTAPTYQWQINGIDVTGEIAATFTTTTLVNGDIVTVIMTSNDPCANPVVVNSNPFTVEVSVLPNLIITNPAAVCATGTVDLTAAGITNGSTAGLTYTYWANAAATVALANASNVAIGGTYYIKGTTAEGCSVVKPVIVSFLPIPTAILSGGGIICEGSNKTLTVTLAGTPPFQLVYTNGTVSTTVNSIASNTYQFTVTPLANTTYTITSVTDANCSNTGTSASATINVEPAIPGIRYPAVVATANVPLTLTSRILGNDYSYNWTPATGLSDPTINNPVFIYDRQTEYWIEMTSGLGCTTVDTLLVKMLFDGPLDTESDIFVPKAWSPNNDGHNDKLFPIPVKIKELKYFRIFNRWGQLVFETNILRNGWDGIFHGQPQVMDTYTWTLEAIGEDGKYFKRAGNSVLVR